MKLAILRALYFLVDHMGTLISTSAAILIVSLITGGVRCGDCNPTTALWGFFLSSIPPVTLYFLPILGVALAIQHQDDILGFIRQMYHTELNRIQEEQLCKKEKLARKDNFELEADEEVKQLIGNNV